MSCLWNLINECFAYNEEHVLSSETCRKFNGTKTYYYISKDQGKFDFSRHDTFKENIMMCTNNLWNSHGLMVRESD